MAETETTEPTPVTERENFDDGQGGQLPAAPRRRLDLQAVQITRRGAGAMFMPNNMQEVVDFASMMAKSDFAVPPKFRGNPGACLAVAIQALRWEMDPYAVIQKAYVTKAKDGSERLAYEAQLIAAVVNTRAPIVGRIKLRYEGEGMARKLTVIGRFIDADEDSPLTTPMLSQITVQNSPLWKADPDQQLAYYGQRAWGRRWCPEVLLGVYAPDEVQQFDADAVEVDVVPQLAGTPRPKDPALEPAEPDKPKPKPTARQRAATAAEPAPGGEGGGGDGKAATASNPAPAASQTPSGASKGGENASDAPPADNPPPAEHDDTPPADDGHGEGEGEDDADAVRQERFDQAEAMLLRAKDNLKGIDAGDAAAMTAYDDAIKLNVREFDLDPEDKSILLGRWNTTVLEHKKAAAKAKPKKK